MTAKIVNFGDCNRGDTINARQYTVTDDLDNPFDLTGATIRCHFKCGNNVIEKEIGNGITVDDPASGIFVLDKFKIEIAGSWRYDIEITYANTDVKTYIKGSIKVIQDITI